VSSVAREKKRGKRPRTPKRLMRLFSVFPVYDRLEAKEQGGVALEGISFLVRALESFVFQLEAVEKVVLK